MFSALFFLQLLLSYTVNTGEWVSHSIGDSYKLGKHQCLGVCFLIVLLFAHHKFTCSEYRFFSGYGLQKETIGPIVHCRGIQTKPCCLLWWIVCELWRVWRPYKMLQLIWIRVSKHATGTRTGTGRTFGPDCQAFKAFSSSSYCLTDTSSPGENCEESNKNDKIWILDFLDILAKKILFQRHPQRQENGWNESSERQLPLTIWILATSISATRQAPSQPCKESQHRPNQLMTCPIQYSQAHHIPATK